MSIQVQSVLFRNSVDDVARLVTSTAAATRYAVAKGRVARVEVRLGDCSPVPVLDAETLAQLRAVPDLAGVAYDFFDENLFTAAGHNRLAAAAETDYLLVQNPDTTSSPPLLAELAKAVTQPSVGMAEARQIPLEHPKAFDPFRGDTSWASTACVMIERRVFEDLGGFDPDHFPLYCDDVDFSWRLRMAGLRIVHVPRAVVFHDKRIDVEARMAPTALETYSGSLARLMLCDRYGRPDVKDETIRWIEAHGTPDHRKALREYQDLARRGRTPARLPDAAAVAEFTDGEYAHHRW